jgi:hypothetical protein
MKAQNKPPHVLQFQDTGCTVYSKFFIHVYWYGFENYALAGWQFAIWQYDNGAGNLHYMAHYNYCET